jgi:MFS family permease
MAGDGDDRLLSREFVTLGLASMLAFGSVGAVNPVLPRFVRDELGGSNTAVGLVIGSFAVSAILIRPFLGRLGDRRGLRLLVQMGCLLAGTGLVANLLVHSVAMAVPARLLVGAGQAAIMTGATTLAVNLAPAHRRGEATSYILVSFHFGLALGPVAGELLLEAGSFQTVWLATGGLALAGAGVASALPRRAALGVDPEGGLFHKASIPPGITMGLGVLAFAGFQGFLVLFAQDIGIDHVAPVFLVSSVTVVVVRVLGARLPDRLGPVRGGSIALSLIATGLFMVSIWQTPTGLYAATIVNGFGSALLFPSMAPAAIEDVPESRRASALATFTLFIDLGSAFGAPTFGIISSATSYGTSFAVGAGVCLVALAYLRLVLAPGLHPDMAMLPLERVIDPAVDSA